MQHMIFHLFYHPQGPYKMSKICVLQVFPPRQTNKISQGYLFVFCDVHTALQKKNMVVR